MGYPGFATCGGIFRGSMGEFICAFSTFFEVQNAMAAEFYGVIHAMEEAQKTGLTNVSGLNVIMLWFMMRLLLGLMFHGCFVINEILVLIIVGKSGSGLLIFFMK